MSAGAFSVDLERICKDDDLRKKTQTRHELCCGPRAKHAQSAVVNTAAQNIDSASPPEQLASRPILPFLKWAGGKRWLVQRYPELFPAGYKRHIEPFAGSAAVFFHKRPAFSLLNDANAELVGTYKDIKYRWKLLYDRLKQHALLHSDEYYYEVRSHAPLNQIERSARLLYLNRSCWNGLYRVNKNGIFNVPRGTKDIIVSDADDFRGCSQALSNTILSVGDFSQVLEQAKSGDFVLVDPPYTVAHNMNGFVKYNDQIFSWEDQKRLAFMVEEAANRGAHVLVTNADHISVRDLYCGLGQHITLNRSTVISGKSTGRQSTTELAVKIGY